VDLADSRLPFLSALVDMYCFYPFPNDLTKTVSPFPSPILHEISIDISTFNYCAPTYNKASIHRSEEHTSELQSRFDLVCRLLLLLPHRSLHSFPTRRSSDLGGPCGFSFAFSFSSRRHVLLLPVPERPNKNRIPISIPHPA